MREKSFDTNTKHIQHTSRSGYIHLLLRLWHRENARTFHTTCGVCLAFCWRWLHQIHTQTRTPVMAPTSKERWPNQHRERPPPKYSIKFASSRLSQCRTRNEKCKVFFVVAFILTLQAPFTRIPPLTFTRYQIAFVTSNDSRSTRV